MNEIDIDGAYRLFGAIMRQWLADARRNPFERQQVAAFLDLDAAEVRDLCHGLHRFFPVQR